MFIKSILSKFEWTEEELPENITSILLENIILTSSNENFVVVRHPNKPEEYYITNRFNVMQRDKFYGFPILLNAQTFNNGQIATSDFVLFSNFKIDEIPMRLYISYYSKMISKINQAIDNHIDGSKLIATFEVRNSKEKSDLKETFKDFSGIKIFQSKDELSKDNSINMIQFEVNNQMEILEKTKHELEKDLSTRLGIDYGIDKTHQIESNIENSEQIVDLLNSYELKMRKDFCKRYNKFTNKMLDVKIHEINKDSTIEKNQNKGIDNGNNITN